MSETQDALVAVDKALDMVAALCKPRGTKGARDWIMSIPARPDHDPDLVISNALTKARDALRAAQPDADARRLREALAAAVEWGERHGERVAVGAGLGVGEWEACAPPWWRQAREALDAALAPAERPACEVCGEPSAGRTLDDVELCEQHGPAEPEGEGR